MLIVGRRNGGDVPINQERSAIYIDLMEGNARNIYGCVSSLCVARQSGTRADTLY
jgi:hypothetical protein